MRATAYHRLVDDTLRISGPGVSSMNNPGFDAASVAKKKSGPCPSQALPEASLFESKLETIASRRLGLAEFAISMSSLRVDFGRGDALLSAAKSTPLNECIDNTRHTILRTS